LRCSIFRLLPLDSDRRRQSSNLPGVSDVAAPPASPVYAFYADQYVLPLPSGHRFPMGKYARLRERLPQVVPRLQLVSAPAATDGELALVHAPEYVRAVVTGNLPEKAQREIGFPWSPQMVERSRRSTGATVAAARLALGLPGSLARQAQGLAGNLAGGTHHASANKGGGFCVFNDVAVASRLMQVEWSRLHRRGEPLRVAIIDLDVHQGNGTASIFAGDESVFTVSLHGEKNFPFRKEASDLDVDLPDGCGDVPYLEALEQALEELGRRFEPGLVFYLAGADAHEGDRLGRLKLSFDGMQARDRRVFDWAWQRRIPLAFVMAGGYGHDIETTVQVQIGTWQVAFEYWQKWQRP
jgi:acetoin utilization deacetylase AcuC-like enzyme